MSRYGKRPWDGRLRRVVKVLNRRKSTSTGGFQRELLECGHLYAISGQDAHTNPGMSPRGVFRVCGSCK